MCGGGRILISRGPKVITTTSAASVAEPVRAETRLQRTGVIIPTCNAGRYWPRMHAALVTQGIAPDRVLVVDSTSSDDTVFRVRQAGYGLVVIPRKDFRHGATRHMASKFLPWAEVLLYLTQDAIPARDNSIEKLLRAFDDPKTGAVYGRQLPREGANLIERHARLFNYPPVSQVRDFESRKTLGFKAAFFSNSFAAYRASALEEVGGFPGDTIVSEEVTVAARMLMSGWKVAYAADATVVHSHPLTVREEFRRYFDIAVHHAREPWLLETFGRVHGEGRAFVSSEFNYLLRNGPALLPLAAIRNLSKLCAYQIGLRERLLPVGLKKALSFHPNYWRKDGHAGKTAALEPR